MSEMIERVALALCKEIGVPGDAMVAENTLDDLKPAWKTQLPKARAAITAMREPTTDMVLAGQTVHGLLTYNEVKNIFGAMIDAAVDAAELEREKK